MRRIVKKTPKKIKKSLKSSPRRVKKKVRKAHVKASRKLLKKIRKSFKKNKIGGFLKSVAASVTPQNEAPATREFRAQGFELPSSYHENKLTLLVRDPWWIFAFWEVTPEREKEVLRDILHRGLHKDKTVLRIYDVTGTTINRANTSFDIEINFFTNNWYVDVGKPDTDWVAELGIRTTNGYFYPFVRSNTVRTPRFGLSDVLDEEWMMPDELYWKLFGRMMGLSGQKSSLDVREVLERYLKGMVSSEGFSASKELPKSLTKK